jgi:hypothetical protein
MINWIKKTLGIAPAATPVAKKAPVVTKAPVKKPVAAKKPAATATKAKKQTKATLDKLTKMQIDELAKTELGIELDRRKTKDAMIKDYMSAQKK